MNTDRLGLKVKLAYLWYLRLHGNFTIPLKISDLTYLQAFTPTTLDTAITWAEVKENRAVMITGRGQKVYWKGCNVTVYEKDSDGNEKTTKLENWPEGEGLASVGTKLYITDGKVKEI